MSKKTKKALVLSGGSIKGAFQAGAIMRVLESGFEPGFISGISVGSLNAAYIVNQTGNKKNKQQINWAEAGKNLVDFWNKNITNPNSIAKRRKKVTLVSQIIRKKFNGILNTTPLRQLVKRTITLKNLHSTKVELRVGAVNLIDGDIRYFKPGDPNFIDYIIASTAIPVLMPVSYPGGSKLPYQDGGLRDSAPLKPAIKWGATKIICVACHPKKLAGKYFNPGNITQLAERLMDIISNENVNNDIDHAVDCNKYLPKDGSKQKSGSLKGYRKIKITVIRPDIEVSLDLENFTSKQIKQMIRSGYETAKKVI